MIAISSSLPSEQATREIEEMREFMKPYLTSPEKAREFLQSAGILDENGKLAARYRPEPALNQE
ncbi:hypothetical protein DB346_09985 [Verrucomicrobia bacterium LW23]|nr:hypothetical protein DB346_09985 [Verrucomicrobia bacterium LW23]